MSSLADLLGGYSAEINARVQHNTDQEQQNADRKATGIEEAFQHAKDHLEGIGGEVAGLGAAWHMGRKLYKKYQEKHGNSQQKPEEEEDDPAPGTEGSGGGSGGGSDPDPAGDGAPPTGETDDPMPSSLAETGTQGASAGPSDTLGSIAEEPIGGERVRGPVEEGGDGSQQAAEENINEQGAARQAAVDQPAQPAQPAQPEQPTGTGEGDSPLGSRASEPSDILPAEDVPTEPITTSTNYTQLRPTSEQLTQNPFSDPARGEFSDPTAAQPIRSEVVQRPAVEAPDDPLFPKGSAPGEGGPVPEGGTAGQVGPQTSEGLASQGAAEGAEDAAEAAARAGESVTQAGSDLLQSGAGAARSLAKNAVSKGLQTAGKALAPEAEDAGLFTAEGVLDALGPAGEVIGALVGLGSLFAGLFHKPKDVSETAADTPVETQVGGIDPTALAQKQAQVGAVL